MARDLSGDCLRGLLVPYHPTLYTDRLPASLRGLASCDDRIATKSWPCRKCNLPSIKQAYRFYEPNQQIYLSEYELSFLITSFHDGAILLFPQITRVDQRRCSLAKPSMLATFKRLVSVLIKQLRYKNAVVIPILRKGAIYYGT